MIVIGGMPDVIRSDSQRSDASQKPRVSFNRDVHVKRIVPREKLSFVGALSGDGRTTPLVTSSVRKEKFRKSKKEAKRILQQADRLDCVSSPNGVTPNKFYTLPHRKKKKREYFSGSLERRNKRRKSLEHLPPKKPPRTFAASNSQKSSIFDIFKKDPKAKSNLRRTVSDVSDNSNVCKDKKFRPRSGSDSEEILKRRNQKKQLSPIIEVTQREDYFSAPELDRTDTDKNKENVEPKPFARKKQKESITAQLKQFIDEVDEEIYKETGIRPTPTTSEERKPPQPIIIDVDKAEQISKKAKKFKNTLLGKKLKSITHKKKPTNEAVKIKKSFEEINLPLEEQHTDHPDNPGIKIKETIKELEQPTNSPKMIHSSQKPAEKLPLTKGRTVNNMVKRLSYESTSPPLSPLKTNVLISPHASIQHNNNQPFSYTRGLSPEKCMSNESSPTSVSPVIYAQVVCGTNGSNPSKQTIHTAYSNGKKHSYSDSDEGLGGEEHSGFKSVTHFRNGFDEVDKLEEESPITPKFRNGYSSYERTTQYIDSSARGRGDGMDSKRREFQEHSYTSSTLLNRTDLAARRDQLESRINRRVNDNSLRTSPEYLKGSYPTNVYVSETTSKYYKGRSSSPVGYTQKYVSGVKPDKSRQYDIRFDTEPKSFDSQVSSSPEYRRYEHKSSPDIYYGTNQDSLKRENIERRTASSNYKSDYFEENDKRERFVDSGIENDCRRDSGDNFRSRPNHRRDYCNESEDEGFASSLLIASERQHTEDNVNNRRRHDYDSDRAISREDDPYRNVENLEYKTKYKPSDYAPRERSIDDGSHYDPRIDKDVEVYTLRRSEKKPPKPEKKSSLEKVKSLFTRDTKKKKEKSQTDHGMVREESLRARYIEYKGRDPVEPKFKKQDVSKQANFDYTNRRRLSTPSPSPTRAASRNVKSESTHGSWFKSLDRLSRKKSKKGEKEGNFTSGTEEETPTKPTKNLRFFGDTDQESNDSVRHKHRTRTGMPLKPKSQSTRDLHNISEEFKSPRSSYKSMTNISESEKENRSSRVNLKPPMSPSHRTPSRETSRHDKERSRRRKNEVSSVESSTEGDSSQQSQKSIVYLHAATVGDIPGPGYIKNGKRAASREDLASNGSRVQQVKTLSRSFSVLAPWRPRHPREALDIDYTQQPKNGKNGKFEQKPYKTSSSRKDSSSTLKKKAQESRKNQNGSTLLKLSKSRENLASHSLGRSREELSKGSNSTLYKKKEKLPKEHSRYNREREDKKLAAKSLSTESLGGQERRHKDVREISRSVSMPRDPDKSAGWFKVSKKNKYNSSQRL